MKLLIKVDAPIYIACRLIRCDTSKSTMKQIGICLYIQALYGVEIYVFARLYQQFRFQNEYKQTILQNQKKDFLIMT